MPSRADTAGRVGSRSVEPTLIAHLDRLPGDATALRLPSGDVDYATLRGWVTAAADELAGGGIGAGHRVLLRSGDDVSRLVVSLAIQRVGAAVVSVNPATIGPELAFVVERSAPMAIVADEGLRGDVDMPDGAAAFVNERGRLTRRAATAQAAAPRPPEPGDAASILFTTGSSARPKAAVLSHHAHMTMGRDLAVVLGVTASDRFLVLAPLFHVGGWSTAALPALATGCSLVMPGPFSASRFWADVERWRPTLWTTGLAFLEMVAARGGEPPREIPFRHVITNLRPDTWKLARERLRLPIGTYYGLTENDGRGTIALGMTEYERGFVGRPYLPADGVRVTADGRELAPGEVGEIELRSESAMTGYFRDPEATAATLRPGGWIATGDLGTVRADGTVYVHGRIKNMIKRAGENISAEEVELSLMEHPEVHDAMVVGVPDRIREEEVKALVVRTPGAGLSAEDLHGFCAERMTAFKVPRYIQFVDELPRTISGKPDIGTVRRTMATPEGAWDGVRQRDRVQAQGGVNS